jgi:hypothetical protein
MLFYYIDYNAPIDLIYGHLDFRKLSKIIINIYVNLSEVIVHARTIYQ